MTTLSRRLLGSAALLLLLLGVPVVIVSPSLAEHFLFFPDTRDPGPPPTLHGVSGEVVTVETADGMGLRSWWYEAASDAPAVLLLHGNAGDVADRVPLVRGLVRRRISVLLLEYRGYGGNAGDPTIEGLIRDAAAGIDAVRSRVGEGRTILFGRSLGGALGLQALDGRRVAGAILEATFTSLKEMAESVYPIVPSFVFHRLEGVLDGRSAVARLDAPLLVVHGTGDSIVPLRMGLALLEAATEPKEWYPVQGAGHNDVFAVGGDRYFDRLADFVRGAAGEAGSP